MPAFLTNITIEETVVGTALHIPVLGSFGLGVAGCLE
jgi:hypothetical protein